MGFILVEQTQTSVEHTKFSLLYFVDHNQTMLVEHNHTMPVEHTNVTHEYYLDIITSRKSYFSKIQKNINSHF